MFIQNLHMTKAKNSRWWWWWGSEVVGVVEIFEEFGVAVILGAQILDVVAILTSHVLANDVVPLLRVLSDVVQLFHPLEKQHVYHLHSLVLFIIKTHLELTILTRPRSWSF